VPTSGCSAFAATAAAGSSGQVLAVEPDTAPAELLHRSAAFNQAHALMQLLPAAAKRTWVRSADFTQDALASAAQLSKRGSGRQIAISSLSGEA
jgi:hypothetical protein